MKHESHEVNQVSYIRRTRIVTIDVGLHVVPECTARIEWLIAWRRGPVLEHVRDQIYQVTNIWFRRSSVVDIAPYVTAIREEAGPIEEYGDSV